MIQYVLIIYSYILQILKLNTQTKLKTLCNCCNQSHPTKPINNSFYQFNDSLVLFAEVLITVEKNTHTSRHRYISPQLWCFINLHLLHWVDVTAYNSTCWAKPNRHDLLYTKQHRNGGDLTLCLWSNTNTNRFNILTIY